MSSSPTDRKIGTKHEGGFRLSKDSFYGGKKLKIVPVQVRVERQVQQIHEKLVPLPFKSSLLGPSRHWRVFFRQQEAFDFARSAAQDLKVFSYESDVFPERHGQRLFLAASIPHFWHYYSQLSSPHRHHYEVIPEGAVCHLYFDLEFNKVINSGCDGVALVAIFIKYVCGMLKELHNVACSPDDVLQLDASTNEKFSNHLVFHLDNAVFRDNIHAGLFVHHLCDVLLVTVECVANNGSTADPPVCTHEVKCDKGTAPKDANDSPDGHHAHVSSKDGPKECDTNQPWTPCGRDCRSQGMDQVWLHGNGLSVDDLARLIVKDKHGNKVLFCDTGVYTKNRNFRLFLSCKLGKANPLLIADQNLYKPKATKEMLPIDIRKQLFLDSLVTNIPYTEGLRLLSGSGSRCNCGKETRFASTVSSPKSAFVEGMSIDSPYPEVDRFVSSVIHWGGVVGTIRRWAYFQQGELLIYDIAHNRWCHNIGRAHHSNNIMVVADLQRGVYYQKCHDPSCRAVNYKSPEWPLPNNVLPSNYFQDGSDFELGYDVADDDTDLDDDVLLKAVTDLEQSQNKQHEDYVQKQRSKNCCEEFELDDHDLLEAVTDLEQSVIPEKVALK